jgi:Derlin-2/3
MPVGIEAWITQIPPITRAWLALSVLISLAVVRRTRILVYSRLTCLLLQQCQLITPLQLYYSPRSAFINVQVCARLR